MAWISWFAENSTFGSPGPESCGAVVFLIRELQLQLLGLRQRHVGDTVLASISMWTSCIQETSNNTPKL
jgi:hypothetical protein